MAIECVLIKGLNGCLHPATEEDAEKLSTIKMGRAVKVTVTQFHNLRFHQKLFCLFKLAYEIWNPEPMEVNGRVIGKSFDQFREDLTILAGHHEAAIRLDGSIRYRAKSLSFARMSDDVKVKVFKDVLSTTWSRVLKHGKYKSPEEAEEVVQKLLGYE